MGNKATGGPFAPLVVVVRGIVGEKDFNKLRGKAISLHSQGALRCVPCAARAGLAAAAVVSGCCHSKHCVCGTVPPARHFRWLCARTDLSLPLSLVRRVLPCLLLQLSRSSAASSAWTTSRCRASSASRRRMEKSWASLLE